MATSNFISETRTTLKRKMLQRSASLLLTPALFLAFSSPVPAAAQYQNRGHGNFYNGAREGSRGGGYDHGHDRGYDRGYDNHQGGIGPGKGALIGAGGGAVLGAIFGGGAKGALIGGAAGAGIGAIAGKVHQDHRDDRYRRR